MRIVAVSPIAARVLVLCAALASLSADDAWPMRWRVFSDAAAGASFSYPYAYSVQNQYMGEMSRAAQTPAEANTGKVKVVTINGKQMRVIDDEPGKAAPGDVRFVTASLKTLPPELAGDLKAAAGKLVGAELAWKPYDYYAASPNRPHAAVAWAPKEVQAVIGEAAGTCALVAKSGDRLVGVVMTGARSEFDNQEIIDSFEILSGAKGKLPAHTWREDEGRRGHVFDSAGRVVRAENRNSGAPWAKGWDMETAHFHITTDVSPARLVQYGAYLEALYKAYANLYEPDSQPPYKFEIHILNAQDEFMAAAAANGFPVGQGIGGFFTPYRLSIFAFEGVAAVTAGKMTVENVLAHECSHQFLHMTCNGSDHVPTWINEGLAVYFESGYVSGNTFIIQPPKERIDLLKRIYHQDKSTLHPLDQYLDHHGPINGEDYGEVYAMTHFWLFGSCENDDPAHCKHKTCGLARFRQYWQALKRHEDGAKAFEDIFMKDMIKAKGSRQAAIDAWEGALIDYVKRL